MDGPLPRLRALLRDPVAWAAWLSFAVTVAIGKGLLSSATSGLATGAAVALLPIVLLALGYAIASPTVAATVMIVVETANLSDVINNLGFSLAVVQCSLALGAASIAMTVWNRRSLADLIPPWWFTVGIVVYLASQALGVLGSIDRAESSTAFLGLVRTFLFVYILFVLARVSGRLATLSLAFVLTLAGLSLLGVLNQVVFGATTAHFGGLANVTDAGGELTTTPRQSGPVNDSNFWGRHLIMGLPFAVALLYMAYQRKNRVVLVLAGAATVLIPASMYLTQSRGTYLAALATMGIWVVLSGSEVRKLGLKLLPLLGVLFFVPGIGDRFIRLIEDVGSSHDYGVDPSVLGRTAAQQIAWMMFRDRPFFGFGPDTYLLEIPHYAGLVKTAVLSPTIAPHNLYAQIAAETGIVGLVGWCALLAAVVVPAVIRALDVPAPANRPLLAAAVAAIAGWSIASVFLHMAYPRTFGVMLALACAIGIDQSDRRSFRIEPIIDRVRRVGAVLAIAAISAAMFATILTLTSTRASSATQAFTLIPAGDWYTPYQLDIRSRNLVMPTYADTMALHEDFTTLADPPRGIITITTSAATDAEAAAQLDAALAAANTHLVDAGLDKSYTLRKVGDVTVEQTREFPLRAWTAASAGALVTLAVSVVTVRSSRRQELMEVPHGQPST